MKNKCFSGYGNAKNLRSGRRNPFFRRALLCLVVLLGMVQMPVEVRAQSGRLTLHLKDKSLVEVMDAIEKQSGYQFYYNSRLLDLKQQITVDANDESVLVVLDRIFGKTSISYQINGTDIILTAPGMEPPRRDKKPGGGIELRGVVRNVDGDPLVGATVMVMGTDNGTITDGNGYYTITVPDKKARVRFSYLGYVTTDEPVGERTVVNVTLKEDFNLMDEVVVIGYGVAKKGDLTGSVATVKMSEIEGAPVLSVDQALQGKVSGADIMTTSGEPGAGTSIRIRGTRSVSASNEPLIVVDGVMDAVRDLNDINSADIESISILKDASSTAIYGSRGSNGVIIITTKKGTGLKGKPNITLKADMGFSYLATSLDVMDATEFARYTNDRAFFSPTNTIAVEGVPMSQYPYPDPYSVGKGTDWIDEITRVAPYQNYNLSVSGSNGGNTYYAALGYNDTQGVIKKSGQSRITGRLNLDYKLLKWLKVGFKGSYTFRDQDMNLAEIGGTSYWQAAQYLSPFISPDSDFNPLWGNGQKINTPSKLIELNTHFVHRHSMNFTGSLEADPLPGLKLRSQVSYSNFQRHEYRYYPSTLPRKSEEEGGDVYRAEYDEGSILNENTITYKYENNNGHSFDLLGGFTAYTWKTNNFTLSGKGYLDDVVKWNNLNAVTDKETYSAGSSSNLKSKMSFLARFNYNYKQKYYITLTGRYDGASNFAANNKWGFFPSAAFKWNVSNERFMRRANWIEDLSLRLSAGRTGNDAISAFRSVAAMSSTTYSYLFGGKQPASFYPSRLDSPNLTWEKTDLYNIALDFSLFRRRLDVTLEAYTSTTRDLLLTIQTAAQTGYTNRFANLGKTTNKGIELSLTSYNISTARFSWSTGFTLSHNVQNVVDIGNEDFVTAFSSSGNNPYMMYGYVAGYPLNSLWGFRYGGTWKSVEEFERNSVTKAYASATIIAADEKARKNACGLPRYYDMNRDGTLSQEDLVYMGSSDPWLYGGLQNTFSYGPFRLGVYFTYSLGGKIYNFTELYMGGSYMSNQYRYMLDGWHPVRNPESDIPRAGAFDTDVPSDRQIHDASYLRLKNLSFSYTLDLRDRSKIIRNIVFSMNVDNVWIWKKYNGFDPDVSTSSESVLRRLDLGAYPRARTFVFSIQLRY